ncbi:MAG TPA: methyltransferase domain-containing protein [Chloroflexota bacterium]
MKDLTDRDYLLQFQYRDASNYEARVALHRRFRSNPQELPRWFMEHLQVPENGRVLEVGCGPGGYWTEIADMIPRSWQITVTDFSVGMVAQARQRLAALDRPFTVMQADVQDLPFPDETFDAVIANFMLYHVPDRPRAFAKIHRVLRPGGRLFAMTHGGRHMHEFKDTVNRAAPGVLASGERGFSLENGANQLRPWFDQITLARYPDALLVTEAEPLIAFLRSYRNQLSEQQARAVRAEFEAELAIHGVIHIGLDSGMVSGVRR